MQYVRKFPSQLFYNFIKNKNYTNLLQKSIHFFQNLYTILHHQSLFGSLLISSFQSHPCFPLLTPCSEWICYTFYIKNWVALRTHCNYKLIHSFDFPKESLQAMSAGRRIKKLYFPYSNQQVRVSLITVITNPLFLHFLINRVFMEFQ